MTLTLEQMKCVDLQTVDRETLIDANDVNVDIDLPKTERMIKVANQMGNNLYCFKVGNTVVKIGHSKTSTATVDDRVKGWMQTL
jgi:hypothetical protein